MSIANDTRTEVAYVLLAIGVLLLLIGIFSNSSWGFFALPLGIMLLVMGAVMCASVSVINGVPWLVKLVSRHSEPVWDGEIIHTDGGEFKIRYDFDHQGTPWFVASDVCSAIGTKNPSKDASRWGGV